MYDLYRKFFPSFSMMAFFAQTAQSFLVPVTSRTCLLSFSLVSSIADRGRLGGRPPFRRNDLSPISWRATSSRKSINSWEDWGFAFLVIMKESRRQTSRRYPNSFFQAFLDFLTTENVLIGPPHPCTFGSLLGREDKERPLALAHFYVVQLEVCHQDF